MRPFVDCSYRVSRHALALLRWRTRGVRAMAFDGQGRLLLVRHRYGRSDLWMLPGGGIGRREAPDCAAAREVREETGCTLDALVALGTFAASIEGRRDTVHLFRGCATGRPVADGVEVAEARFFALHALPEATSPATRRRIDEWLGTRVADGRW